jgi:hypothetical protein
MNHGFLEVHELAEAIVASLAERGPIAAMFERYDRDQQARWRRLLGIDVEIEARGLVLAWQGARLVACLPASDRDLDALLAQLELRLIRRESRVAAAPTC